MDEMFALPSNAAHHAERTHVSSLSERETTPCAQRAAYKSEHADREDVWRCPGSHVYYGPETEDTVKARPWVNVRKF